ncbi:alpha/beta hydrolase [Leptolyngbya sp. CCNP1308]|uniref:alpha/beta hydrolase n=1 Tax=Leptolyngbya sp. CCNP1308 TaxID=3110255 RepID=UPI002B213B98|nr:alpha/beta hydrolase [Leptolyngbya sp. CCNP1308]MEA5449547.1 alpha/beta hydrolase [Leptolyngbya sp. CCNP1308]
MRVPKTYTRRLLTATAVILLLLAGAPFASTQSAQKPAAELERFYNQELTFGSCQGFATTAIEAQLYVDPFECSRLEVPLNYNQPEGETMQIAVLRLPAQDEPDQRIGSLVLNPGGPGGSGLFTTPLTAVGLKETPIIQRFDLVGFDPRGVGASTPAISCFTDAESDRGENQTTLLGTSGEWTADDTRELMEQCAEGSGGEQVLAAVGTRNAARDMDVLRAALGDEKLTFAGQSYGTRLGAVYAEMFPQNVRAMVFDGVIDPRQGSAERRLSLHAGFQRSFDLMAEFCAQSPNCPLGNDPEQATAVFQTLVQPLIDNPVPAGNGRTLNFFQATGGVGAGLYTAEAWPQVIDGIAQLKTEGRGDQLLTINDNFIGRDPNGLWNNFIDANLAINCNDEERRTPEQEADLRRQIFDVNPFLDTGRDVEGVTRDACEFWPSEPTLGFPYAQDVEGLPDTLIISITGDPATPYGAGASLAEALGGTVLTVEGERHTVAMEGISPCVNAIVADYLINLELPAEGDRCVL